MGSKHTAFWTAWKSLVYGCCQCKHGKCIAVATEHCEFKYRTKHTGNEPEPCTFQRHRKKATEFCYKANVEDINGHGNNNAKFANYTTNATQ